MTFDSLLFDMKKKSYEEQYSASEEEEESVDGKGGDQLMRETMLMADAYKNIEISEVVYIDKFTDLRQAFWDV